MPKFNTLTQMIEYIKDELVKQGEPCTIPLRGSAACVFFNSKGNRCAAGHIMDKEKAIEEFGDVEHPAISERMNSASITEMMIKGIISPVPNIPDGVLVNVLQRAQNIHDTTIIETWPEEYNNLINHVKQIGYQ